MVIFFATGVLHSMLLDPGTRNDDIFNGSGSVEFVGLHGSKYCATKPRLGCQQCRAPRKYQSMSSADAALIKGGEFTAVAKPRVIKKAELRAIIEELEDRNLSTDGEPKQLVIRLGRELMMEEMMEEKRKNVHEQDKEYKRKKLLQKLTEKFGVKMWKNFGNHQHVRYVETYTNTQYRRKDRGVSRKKQNKLHNTGENVAESAEADAEVAGTSKRVMDVDCALCERRFTPENLCGSVTLRAIWKKREDFPFKVQMPRVLKNNWTKLYSQVKLCPFCSQMFQLPMTETIVPFPKLNNKKFRFVSPRDMRSCGFGTSAIQRPGLWAETGDAGDCKEGNARPPNRRRVRPSSAASRLNAKGSSKESTKDGMSISNNRPTRPSTASRTRRGNGNMSPRGFGISSKRFQGHSNPKKENLKEFMAQRHAPSYNPFQKKESEVRPGKKGSKPVNPLAKKIERRGRKLKRKAGKKKKKPTDWTLHGKWNDPKIP